MNFDQEIKRLCEEAVACTSEAGAAELARQAQSLMHARIEELRGNLTAPSPSPRENCLGLVVGAFLMDASRRLPRRDARRSMTDDGLETLRKRLSEAHEQQPARPFLHRWLAAMSGFVRRRTPSPNAASGD